MAHYPQQKVLQAARLIAMMLSPVLPLASIFGLCYVYTLWRRLVLVVAFSSIFSLFLGLFTNGDIGQVFSSSAA
jgi:hypothetical protein